MSENVKIGATVRVTVKRTPTSDRAAKTLSRLFLRDGGNRKLARRRKRILGQTLEMRRRGGRLWPVKSKAPRMIQPTTGQSCTVRATLDVIADLKSVERLVEVAAV